MIFQDDNLEKVKNEIFIIKYLFKTLINNGNNSSLRIYEDGKCVIRQFGQQDKQVFKIEYEKVSKMKRIICHILLDSGSCYFNPIEKQKYLFTNTKIIGDVYTVPIHKNNVEPFYIIEDSVKIKLETIPEIQAFDFIVVK